MMKKLFLLAGIGIGIGLMYYMDGERGPQRQQVLRSKVRNALEKAQDPERQQAIRSKVRGTLEKAQDRMQATADDLADKTSAMADEAEERLHGRLDAVQELGNRTRSRMKGKSGAEGIL